MIRVEQIRLLESKVQKAVSLLSSLQDENSLLKTRLGEYEKRVDDLEYLLEEFKEEQQEIEQGIISALNKLETLETAAKQSQVAPQENHKPKKDSEQENQSIPEVTHTQIDHETEAQEPETQVSEDQLIIEEINDDNSFDEQTTSDSITEMPQETDNIPENESQEEPEEMFSNHPSRENEKDESSADRNKIKPPELDIF